MERLEERQMLAGDVRAMLSDGDLVISGDNSANRISVESAGEGRIVVRGFGTRINGVFNAARIFSNVTGDISVQLSGGDDLLRITNVITPADVLVSGGDGNDEIITGRDKTSGDARFAGSPSGPLYVQGALRLYGGNGHDLVFQSDAHIDGLGVAKLGSGDDTLFTQRPAGSGQNVDYGGNLSILPEGGDDVIDLLGMDLAGYLTINDSAGSLYLYARAMDVHGNFRITSAGMADSIDVSATNVRGQFSLASGAGNDRVRISAIANQLSVNLGDGNDGFELVSSNIKSSTVFGGAGDDVFFARYAYGVDALFSGDAGRDIVRTSRSLPNQISSLRKQTIEVTESLV
jgi:hypothetical protein